MGDERDPARDGGELDDLSPAERIGAAASRWVRAHPRDKARKKTDPVEIALFSLMVGVVLLIAGGLLSGFDVSQATPLGLDKSEFLLEAMTQWAGLPVALVLLGVALLAWYQAERTSRDIEALKEEGAGQASLRAAGVHTERVVAAGRLRRGRFALMAGAWLGLLTAAAAIARLPWDFYNAGLNPQQSVQWYIYFELVLGCLAVVVPALACDAIVPMAWRRASRLLSEDDEDEESEPET